MPSGVPMSSTVPSLSSGQRSRGTGIRGASGSSTSSTPLSAAGGCRPSPAAGTAEGGPAGDAVTAISQGKSEKPDLILLDLGLPAGDGYLVMERLGNIDDLASIPVIVFTARDEESHRERALEAGAKAFFQKPVDHAELLSSVRRILTGPDCLQPSVM